MHGVLQCLCSSSIDWWHVLQFSRLNAIYRERRRQLAAGIDVLKDTDSEPKR